MGEIADYFKLYVEDSDIVLEKTNEISLKLEENIKKEAPAKELIKKHSKTFGGTLKDSECIKLTNLSRPTYYKYKRELKEEE